MRAAALAVLGLLLVAGCADRANAQQFQSYWSQVDGLRASVHDTMARRDVYAQGHANDTGGVEVEDDALLKVAEHVAGWNTPDAWKPARDQLLVAIEDLHNAFGDATRCLRGNVTDCGSYQGEETDAERALTQAASLAPNGGF